MSGGSRVSPQERDEAAGLGAAVVRRDGLVALPSRKPAVDRGRPTQQVGEADPDGNADDEHE